MFSNSGKGSGLLLGINLVALIVIGLWTIFFAILFFGLLTGIGALRISEEEEFFGLDIMNHMHMTSAQRHVMKSTKGSNGSSPTERPGVSSLNPVYSSSSGSEKRNKMACTFSNSIASTID